MTNERIKLDPLVNQLARVRLHELAKTMEGVNRAVDEHGYWIEGGSLARYLQRTSPSGDAASEVQLIEYKQIS